MEPENDGHCMKQRFCLISFLMGASIFVISTHVRQAGEIFAFPAVGRECGDIILRLLYYDLFQTCLKNGD